jgi:hypothetical protein
VSGAGYAGSKDELMKSSHAVPFGSIIATPILYVGLFYLLVVPTPPWFMTGVPPWNKHAEYRVGGELARIAFLPMERIDRHLRPDAWVRN